jgi:hypothetical protein
MKSRWALIKCRKSRKKPRNILGYIVLRWTKEAPSSPFGLIPIRHHNLFGSPELLAANDNHGRDEEYFFLYAHRKRDKKPNQRLAAWQRG